MTVDDALRTSDPVAKLDAILVVLKERDRYFEEIHETIVSHNAALYGADGKGDEGLVRDHRAIVMPRIQEHHALLLGDDGTGDKSGLVYRLRILWSVWFGGNGDKAGWGERLRIQQKLL